MSTFTTLLKPQLGHFSPFTTFIIYFNRISQRVLLKWQDSLHFYDGDKNAVAALLSLHSLRSVHAKCAVLDLIDE